jgi:hypothetical protein
VERRLRVEVVLFEKSFALRFEGSVMAQDHPFQEQVMSG